MAAASKTRDNDPKASFNRRLFVGTNNKRKAAKTAPPMGAHQRGLLNRPITVEGAVVFTVRMVVAVGLNAEVASEQLPPVIDAGTEQLKLTLLLKPLMGVMLIVVVPDAPGDAMLNEVGLATTLKLGAPVVMVTVWGEDVEAK
jgi:hypothetical protein